MRLLGTAVGALGIGLAYAATNVLLRLAPPEVSVGLEPVMDLRVLMFCAAATLASIALFGLAPAWLISRSAPAGALKTAGRASSAGPGRQRTRSWLVIGEPALAVMLLTAAGLFLRSFAKLQFVDPGLQAQGVMTAAFVLPQQAYSDPKRQIAFDRVLLDRLQSSPGVVSAALANLVPFSGANESGIFEIKGRPPNPGDPLPFGDERLVTDDYFQTLGIPIKSGRVFTTSDRDNAERAAVIDENLAHPYWKDADPVGQRMVRSERTYLIVGVVGHVKHADLASDSEPGVFYFSMLQRARRWPRS